MSTASLTPGFPIAPHVLERARPVRLLLLDVDGVLTDGTLLIDADGGESKRFHTRDGHGIKLLQHAGVELGIISGRNSRAVEHRAKELGITHLYQGCRDKLPICRQLLTQLALTPEQAAFVGDDVVDLPILLHVGLGISVQDAHPLVKQHAHVVTPNRGGAGAVRDTCELLLYAQGKYADALQPYFAAAGA